MRTKFCVNNTSTTFAKKFFKKTNVSLKRIFLIFQKFNANAEIRRRLFDSKGLETCKKLLWRFIYATTTTHELEDIIDTYKHICMIKSQSDSKINLQISPVLPLGTRATDAIVFSLWTGNNPSLVIRWSSPFSSKILTRHQSGMVGDCSRNSTRSPFFAVSSPLMAVSMIGLWSSITTNSLPTWKWQDATTLEHI